MILASYLRLRLKGSQTPLDWWDVSLFLDGAWRVLHNQIPHHDYFTMIGPATFWIGAIGFLLVDATVYGYEFGITIAFCLFTTMIYSICTKILDKKLALIPAIVAGGYLITIRPYNFPHNWVGVTGYYNLIGHALFLPFILFCIAKTMQSKEKPGQHDALVLGCFLAFLGIFASLAKYTYGSLLVFFVVYLAILSPKDFFRSKKACYWLFAACVVLGLLYLIYLKFDVAALYSDMNITAICRFWYLGSTQIFLRDGLYYIGSNIITLFSEIQLSVVAVIGACHFTSISRRETLKKTSILLCWLFLFYLLGYWVERTISQALEYPWPFFVSLSAILITAQKILFDSQPVSKTAMGKYAEYGFLCFMLCAALFAGRTSLKNNFHWMIISLNRNPPAHHDKDCAGLSGSRPFRDACRFLKQHAPEDARISVFGYRDVDPFAPATGLKPALRGPLYWQDSAMFCPQVQGMDYFAPGNVFGDTDILVIEKRDNGIRDFRSVYRMMINTDFHKTFENDYFEIYFRIGRRVLK